MLLIGGVPAGPQEKALKAGVDIVTGTPGEPPQEPETLASDGLLQDIFPSVPEDPLS